MEEIKIIQLLEKRDETALTNLAVKYGNNCLTIAKNILKNHQDGEECVNDSYLATWNSIPPTTPKSLQAYLYGLTRNIALKKYHHNTAQKRNTHYDMSLEELKEVLPSRSNVEEEIFAQELGELLNQFLESLEKELQILFVLRYWYHDSVEEIAKRRKLKPNTITVKLKRTREKLKIFLSEKGYDYDG